MCLHLKDFFLRRTHLFLAEKDNGQSQFEPVSKRMAELLDWTDEQRKQEIKDLENHKKNEMNWAE